MTKRPLPKPAALAILLIALISSPLLRADERGGGASGGTGGGSIYVECTEAVLESSYPGDDVEHKLIMECGLTAEQARCVQHGVANCFESVQ